MVSAVDEQLNGGHQMYLHKLGWNPEHWAKPCEPWASAEAESQCSSNKGLKQACGCPVPHGDQSLTQAAPGREQNCGEGR